MAETAGNIITDALTELVVQEAEADLEASEVQTAIRYMNRFMFMLDANGTSLGYTEVTGLNDTVTIPNGAIMGLVKNLAVLLAPQFDGVVTPDLANDAREALKAMRKLGRNILATSHPCTLPIGSGNEQGTFGTDTHFYPCNDDNILTETGQSILLEDQT